MFDIHRIIHGLRHVLRREHNVFRNADRGLVLGVVPAMAELAGLAGLGELAGPQVGKRQHVVALQDGQPAEGNAPRSALPVETRRLGKRHFREKIACPQQAKLSLGTERQVKRRGRADVRNVNHRPVRQEQDAALQRVGRDVVRGAKDLVDLFVDEHPLGEQEDFEIQRIEPVATHAVRLNHATFPLDQDPVTDILQ